MNRLLPSIVLVCVTSCNVGQPTKHHGRDADLPNSPARLAQYKAKYAKDYAAYRCDRSEFPVIQLHSFILRQFRSVALSPQLKLRLELGGRIDQPGTHTYRTGSNYTLSTTSGKELCRAESMLLKDGAAESNEPIKVLFTPSESSVLIEEENFGAGGSTRHVIFIPSATPSLLWRVLHLDLPARDTGMGESDDTGTVGGVSGGKIYVEMDGLFYAFPLDKFATTLLGVSNG